MVSAAFQSFGGVDPYPEHFEKAAMLLRGITQGHPFTDGNKRAGFLVAAYYLDLAGKPAPARLDRVAAEALCLAVSAGELRDIAAIARKLKTLWQS